MRFDSAGLASSNEKLGRALEAKQRNPQTALFANPKTEERNLPCVFNTAAL